MLTRRRRLVFKLCLLLIILCIPSIVILHCYLNVTDFRHFVKRIEKRFNTISLENFNLELLNISADVEVKPIENYQKTFNQIYNITNCNDELLISQTKQRGKFLVFYNFVPAELSVKCFQSVTFTTHTDHLNLGNIVTIVKRWYGPVSVAVYAPGNDFDISLKLIAYLRDCQTPLIKYFVTFHLYFEENHFPSDGFTSYMATFANPYDCSNIPLPNTQKSYREENGLFYPGNVGKNIAKQAAQTHFILVADSDLYPSFNVIPEFFQTLVENSHLISENSVFLMPTFKMILDDELPNNKTKLRKMIMEQSICPNCYEFPGWLQWLRNSYEAGYPVKSKRMKNNAHWEPIFIGTKDDPFYDEMYVSGENRNNVVQAYIMCLLDYNFFILDNAFLIHKPKVEKRQEQTIFQKIKNWISFNDAGDEEQNATLLNNTILQKLSKLFEKRPECVLQ